MDSVIYSCSYIDFTLMDGSVTLTTEHHSYELPISSQLGDSYDDNDDNAAVMEINLIFFVTLLMMMLLMLLKMTMLTLLTMMLVNMKRTFQRRASLLLQSRALQIQLKIFLVIEIKYKQIQTGGVDYDHNQ